MRFFIPVFALFAVVSGLLAFWPQETPLNKAIAAAPKQTTKTSPSRQTARESNKGGFSVPIPMGVVLPVLELALGQPLPAWEGQKNVSPEAKSAFLRNEQLELALGKVLPASPKDKDTIKISPAIKANSEYLDMAFGWRLHKHMLTGERFARGTYRCQAHIALENGEPKVAIKKGQFQIEANSAQRALLGPILWAAEQGAAHVISKGMEDALDKALVNYMLMLPQRERLSLKIEPHAFILTAN